MIPTFLLFGLVGFVLMLGATVHADRHGETGVGAFTFWVGIGVMVAAAINMALYSMMGIF